MSETERHYGGPSPEERVARLPAILSYEQVLEMTRRIAEVSTKIDAIAEILKDLKDHDSRLRALETALAAAKGGAKFTTTIVQYAHWLTTGGLAVWTLFHR